jgi:PAS domain S-box-containing protein
MDRTASPDPERVLVLAPTRADAKLSRSILTEAGLSCHICSSAYELGREVDAGAGAVLATEEVLIDADGHQVLQALRRQPQWSDVPILMLAAAGADSSNAAAAMERLSNVTILERPVRITTLVSSLRTALRARTRQYELRDRIEALRLSEERFKLVAEAGHDSIWDLDLASGRLWSTDFGYADLPSSDGGSHAATVTTDWETWSQRLHPDDRERVLRSFQEGLDGARTSWTDEYRLLKPDGSYVYIMDRAHVVRSPRGQPLRTVGARMDISERKRAEETRALHAAIVESSDDAIVSESMEGIILSWNAGAERLFGYKAAEAIGRPGMLHVPADRHEEELAIQSRLRGGHHIEHFETVRLRRDGGRIDVLLSVSPLRDGNGRVFGASRVAHDITRRKQAEQMLRRQAERLRLLWEAASVLLTTEDPETMMRTLFAKIAPHFGLDTYFNFMVNETGEALYLKSCTGVPQEDMAGLQRLEFGQAVCGTVAQRRVPIVATDIQRSLDPKVRLVKGYGIRAYACNPLIAEGRLLGTLSFASRTRDRFAPDEIEFMETICHYVTVAYERVSFVQKLRETDKRKDEFLATLSHELRNPLAPIRNALHIMHVTGNDGASAAQARGMMERQLHQMVRLIDDLLDVSRITKGKLELRKEEVRLADILGNAVETARPLIEAGRHELLQDITDKPVCVHADPVRLAQVFGNLLNNAAKYMEHGGRIWLSASLQGAEAVVSVRDAGMGIPREALPSIFDMFSQVEGSLERSQGGLGIGLTLVRQLVEMHGGAVEARSNGDGQGSEFIVRLPTVPGPLREDEERRDSGEAGQSSCRVLVADDNVDAAESMSIMLQLMGNEVCTVHDGLQAVEQAETFRPDVALLDIGMPKLNGHDAARRIRGQSWGAGIVLAAMTGWGQDEDKRKAFEAGFDRHFTKPVDPADLRAFLGEVQERRQPALNDPEGEELLQ